MYKKQPHLWCNGWHACLKCSKSWVRASVMSTQTIKSVQYSWQHTLINAEHNLDAWPGSAFSLMVC